MANPTTEQTHHRAISSNTTTTTTTTTTSTTTAISTNDNDTLTPSHVDDHSVGHYVVLAVMALVILTALVGNVCNMVVIMKSSHLRHTLSNFFVVSLCTCDLLAASLVMPVAAVTFSVGEWPLSEVACSVAGFATSLFMFVSMATLSVISAERYYSIRLPMHHAGHMTLRKTVAAVSLLWIWGGLLAALPLLGLGSYQFHRSRYHCSFTWHASESGSSSSSSISYSSSSSSSSHRTYVGLVVALCFLLPCGVLLVMNLGILLVARKAASQVRPVSMTVGTMRTSIVTTLTTSERAPLFSPRGSLFSQTKTDSLSTNPDDNKTAHPVDFIGSTSADIRDKDNQHNGTHRPSSSTTTTTTPTRNARTPPKRSSEGQSSDTNVQQKPDAQKEARPIQTTAKKIVLSKASPWFAAEDSGVSMSQAEEGGRTTTAAAAASEGVKVKISSLSRGPGKGHFKAAKTLLMLLAAYTLLWGPYFLLHLHGAIHDEVAASETTELVALWLSFASFAVNPFLYGWMNKAIREELVSLYKCLFCWCCCCPRCSDQDSEMLEGPPDEDFMQFLERTSLAHSTNPRKKGSVTPRVVEHSNRPDISEVNIESSGPF